MRYHGHKNYWEDARTEGAPLPKDAEGKTIVPTVEQIQQGCATVQQFKREAEQKAERLWSQR
jgi:hypothetical protein